MAQRGGLSHINYKRTKGLKVSGGQFVSQGALLTRQGDKWKPGLNVSGQGTLLAKTSGTVYFTKKRGTYHKNKITTFINIAKSDGQNQKTTSKR